MNISPSRHPEIRQRLLQSAAEVFTEKGFQAATVREICQRANANVAAINYHFRDKERLYTEVLKMLHAEIMQHSRVAMLEAKGLPAEQRFRLFVRSYLKGLLGEGRHSWHGKLIVREMAQPTASLSTLVETSIRPYFERTASLIAELMGRRKVDEQMQLCVFSVISQCIYYRVCQPVITRLKPSLQMNPETIDEISDHIIEFSLAAIRDLATRKTKRKVKR